jgi:hypothetical protein
MKKPAAKSKGRVKSKVRAAKAAPAAKAAGKPSAKVGLTSGAIAYTPSPLKSDGWPPFRYPLQ